MEKSGGSSLEHANFLTPLGAVKVVFPIYYRSTKNSGKEEDARQQIPSLFEHFEKYGCHAYLHIPEH